MAYLLFILVNATLFIRPPEVIPGMEDLQLYLYLIVPCLLLASFGVLDQLSLDRLAARPITVCVLGLLLAVLLSHLTHGEAEKAVTVGFEFAKVVLYYLLFVALVNTPARLRTFTFCVVIFAGCLTLLAVLRYNGLIDLPTLDTGMKDIRVDSATGDYIIALRLRGTGIFNDPNDFSVLLVLTIPLTIYWITDGKSGLIRVLFVPLLGLFFYALALTQSRGGFMAVVVGLLILLRARFGKWVSIALIACLLPAMFLGFAGRQTDIFTSGDTAQERYQVWSEGLDHFKDAPLFGIGADEFHHRSRLVAHNSFIHAFAELGLFGGTLFLGAFVYAVWVLYSLRPERVNLVDPTVRRLQPYLLAVLCGFVTLIMTLSRSYIVPTYLMLGLVTAYVQFAVASPPVTVPQLNGRLVGRFALASLAFLTMAYVVVRTLVRVG